MVGREESSEAVDGRRRFCADLRPTSQNSRPADAVHHTACHLNPTSTVKRNRYMIKTRPPGTVYTLCGNSLQSLLTDNLVSGTDVHSQASDGPREIYPLTILSSWASWPSRFDRRPTWCVAVEQTIQHRCRLVHLPHPNEACLQTDHLNLACH